MNFEVGKIVKIPKNTILIWTGFRTIWIETCIFWIENGIFGQVSGLPLLFLIKVYDSYQFCFLTMAEVYAKQNLGLEKPEGQT